MWKTDWRGITWKQKGQVGTNAVFELRGDGLDLTSWYWRHILDIEQED